MASGSSGRTGSGSKGFDFSSNDILCSYDDIGNQEASNGKHTDPMIGNSPGNQDFLESRKVRSGTLPVYNQQEESLNQDVISTVEKTMKKYADNLLRFLEGISSRLSQLELYCYNLEKLVGEMRSDLVRGHNEADLKLRSLEKHLQEVHRSIQVLRDKQELADTQKELTKLHISQKESLATSHPQHSEDGVAPSASDPKNTDSRTELQKPHLALALPHQVPASQAPQNIHLQTQPQASYPSQNQFPNPHAQTQYHPQEQYIRADSQYQRPQLQDLSRAQVYQTPQHHLYPSYQQQFPQQVQQPQQSAAGPTIRPQTPPMYPPYQPTQASNPSPESMPSGYNGAGRTAVQQPPPQHNVQRQPLPQPQSSLGTFGAHLSDGTYPGVGPHPTQSTGHGYMIYDDDGGRVHHPPSSHYSQSGYPPTHVPSIQNPQPSSGGGLLVRHLTPSMGIRSHPYSELIEKVVNMGYGRDHVSGVIQRMEESGQPVDFNAVLDRLNGHSSGGPQRSWSG